VIEGGRKRLNKVSKRILSLPVVFGLVGIVLIIACLYYSTIVGWQLDLVSATILTGGLSVSLYTLIYGVFLKGLEAKETIELVKGSLALQRVRVYHNQDDSMQEIREFVKTNRIKSVLMLEYSTMTIYPLIESLKEKKCDIKLLVENPNYAISRFEAETRIIPGIRSIEELLGDYINKKCEMRCYRTPGSLRGRLFDDKKIIIGWYTYKHDKKRDEDSIWGGTNPMIEAEKGTDEYDCLKEMFASTFYSLWEAETTVDYRVALDEYQKSQGKPKELTER